MSCETIPNKHKTEQSEPLIKNLESNFLHVPFHGIWNTSPRNPRWFVYSHRKQTDSEANIT